MQGLGIGGGAAEGLKEVLTRLFLEGQARQKAQMEQARLGEDMRQADMQHEDSQQRIAQGDRRMGLDKSQFGFAKDRAGVADQQYADAAPKRASDLRHVDAQTGAIEAAPAREQADREFTTTRDKTLHGYRVGEAAARSGDSRASDWQIMTSSNPQTNETTAVRVNRQTGEAQPVTMPNGLQPGGAKQTRLSAGQQDDLSTMKTVEDMLGQVESIGNTTKWQGVGGMGAGSIGQFGMKHFGSGSQEAEQLRNFIGNVQGTIAKLRGGTSFTANEQKLLETYTPTINESAPSIQAKVKSLRSFIASKRTNMMQFAGGPQAPSTGPAKNTDPLGIR